MGFDYFYRKDADRYSFYMLPKVLVKDDRFKNLSSDAKILYCLLLDRNGLSSKNGWIDEEDRVYIIFTVDEIVEALNKSNKTAVKILNELEKTGLIQRVRRGLGKPNIIYVMDFMTDEDEKCKSYIPEVKNLHPGSVKTTLQEVKKVHGTNTNYNKTNSSKTNLSEGQKALGTFQNVFLSDDQLENLRKMMGHLLENYSERLSTYMKGSGSQYKDHEATLLSWFYKDQGKSKKDSKSPPKLEDYDKGDYL